MHTVSYEFLMKPKESAGCHQTLSSRVGAGHETTPEEVVQVYGLCIRTLRLPVISVLIIGVIVIVIHCN